MPTISQFFGIIIQMFWNEHAPPHFHCRYGDHEAIVNIRTLQVMEGDMPRRAINLVLDWAELHQAELMKTGGFVKRSSNRNPSHRWSKPCQPIGE